MRPTSRLTIQDAIETIVAATDVAPLADTVDTVKTGDPTRPLTGIVTTFLATAEVIARAADLGANLIITHEPTFYNHRDDTAWLEPDAVYQAKRRLIDDHGIVIWRFHDYWHRARPDGILRGLIERLDWDHEGEISYPVVATIAPLPFAELAGLIRARLGVPSVRVSGPADLVCRRVGLLAGAPGGRAQIATLGRDDVDAVLCGEINEWETSEYARDAAFFGRPKGLIVVGHQPSEEDGMAYLATWLRPRLPAVAITHVPAGDPLRTV
jgi:putative NIF3 family GTP cyclohydrolase 1 type 2